MTGDPLDSLRDATAGLRGQAAGALEFASAQFSEESLPGGHVYAYFARYFGRGHVPGVVRAVSRL